MNILSLNSVAAGGIVAAVVALWSQVRQALTYVSSFVVVTAHLDPDTTYCMRYLLYTRFRPVPSGITYYGAQLIMLRRRPRFLHVPFHLPAPTCTYYRRWTVLFTHGGHQMTVRGLRGTIDFDRLVNEAIDAYDSYSKEWSEAAGHGAGNFAVNHILGREKGHVPRDDLDRGERTVSQKQLKPVDAINSEDTRFPAPYHHSYRYPREVYVEDRRDAPFERLFFDPEIYEHIEEARQWFRMRQWYADRTIPWTRGWLLHGPAGTGKSSLARAIAQDLGIPLHYMHLSTLSDHEYLDFWRHMVTPCVVLFEDIDAVFHGRENQTSHRSLNFDTVLNSLSGVDSQNGVFLVVTTNNSDLVDPALGAPDPSGTGSTRPGRIDAAICVGHMSMESKRRMAEHILRDWPDAVEVVMTSQPMTPIQFQERCLQEANRRLRQGKPPSPVALAA